MINDADYPTSQSYLFLSESAIFRYTLSVTSSGNFQRSPPLVNTNKPNSSNSPSMEFISRHLSLPGRELLQNNSPETFLVIRRKNPTTTTMVRYVILRQFLRKIPPKYHLGILAYRRVSHHDEDIYEALKFQTQQSGVPFQNTNSQSKIQLTLCRTTTNQTLDWKMETIGQTTTMTMTTTTTKTMMRMWEYTVFGSSIGLLNLQAVDGLNSVLYDESRKLTRKPKSTSLQLH